MGVPRELAICALRLSLGRTSTLGEVDEVVCALVDSARVVRGAAPAPAGS
jgi:cysteine sulfinate desulfinase/cysteine desulfurase-like protein